MAEPMSETEAIARLDDLLDRERLALIQGDLSVIATILEEKEALLERLPELDGPARGNLASLQGKALRNQALLDSALRGIRSVANRFATLRRIRKSLETYDEFGQKTAFPASENNQVEKRA